MPSAVVFDIGRVLFEWQLSALFAKLIADPDELAWFVANVVTEEWHYQHDRGRSLAEMVPERIAEFPAYAAHIHAYAARFNETVPGPVAGMPALVERLHARGVPLYGLTNFGDELWARFRPTQPIFDLFADVIVSGAEKVAKPDPAIYAIAEARTGRRGGELFFTDDNPDNIAAARARGWHAHLFTDATSLETRLVAAGLL
ncbi:HAD family phosphatase [Erythrobacter sp. T5W1-R]|uniref:HAD family hydrolase n=1 Tax=Erythrobacter sp. T5W1-R TaxID=3101752 RepID=UPI002AFE2CD2|nr:HAD family phosphatase [Erythrobacter sp. T5W1-R]MEA1618394.1 HAD family phosphatase [Erythrobacter sp. T5W1-R]